MTVLQPQFLAPMTQYLSTIAGAVNQGQAVQTDAQTKMAQAVVDAMTAPMGAVGRQAAANTVIKTGGVSPLNTSCMVNSSRQTAAGLRRGMSGLGAAFVTLSSGANAGVYADASSPGVSAGAFGDRCSIGFVNAIQKNNVYIGRYGPAAKGCLDLTNGDPQSPNARYIDADTRLSSVLEPLEYPVPVGTHWRPLPNGNISFVGKNAGNNPQPSCTNAPGAVCNLEQAPDGKTYSGIGSELDFAAAWKFCEHLRARLPTPTHNGGALTSADYVSMSNDADLLARTNAAIELCFNAIRYRTACPSTLDSTNTILVPTGGTGQSCAKMQQSLCTRLTNQMSDTPRGLALSFAPPQGANANDPNNSATDQVMANILTACKKGQGISLAAYDWAMAHRCEDVNWMSKILKTNLQSESLYNHASDFECQDQVSKHDKYLSLESKNLQKGIKNLLLLSSMPGMPNQPAARTTQ